MKGKAVIFDIDGVLIDSYSAHLRSWQVVAQKHGQQMTESDFAKTFGQTSREIIQTLWGESALNNQQIGDLDGEKEAAFREIVVANYPWMPGAKKLITDLRAAGFQLAVGSSGPTENVQLALSQLGNSDAIAVAVSGSDVTRGKPHPEVFQIAAERLAIAPANCAVIEDARAGVAAANAAGMLSIALVSTGHTRSEYDAAAHIVGQLEELSADLIATWIDARSPAKDSR